MTVTVPRDPARKRSSSPQTAETKRNTKSHSPERDEEEEETPVRFASQSARRIGGKSKGHTINNYVETPGQSSSGAAAPAETTRGRQPERDFKNVAVSTIMKQVSIVELRKLLEERGQ